jgi:hypothetical protein
MRMNSRQLEKYQATLEGLLREVLPPSRNGMVVRGWEGTSGFTSCSAAQ